MSNPTGKTPAELFDDFIKLEWQDIFRNEVHVKLDNGTRYVPNGGAQGVQLLRKNVNAFDKAIKIWSGPTDDPVGSTQGYDRIVDQAGVEYTWEWFLIDPSRPWASAVPSEVRDRIQADLDRRAENAVTHRAAREQEEEQQAGKAADHTIGSMNERRAQQGQAPLSEKQEESVRESLRRQRAKQS